MERIIDEGMVSVRNMGNGCAWSSAAMENGVVVLVLQAPRRLVAARRARFFLAPGCVYIV
jgi:hypothetical protein